MYTLAVMRFEVETHRRWTALILVLFCVAGIHQGGAAQVLCIGENGHVEVESYGVDCCAEAAESHSSDGYVQIDAANETDANHCGACVDIPLTTSGRIATRPIPVCQLDASVWTANTDVAAEQFSRLTSNTEHVFNLKSSHASKTTLPLLL